jgi:hypothetical protein
MPTSPTGKKISEKGVVLAINPLKTGLPQWSANYREAVDRVAQAIVRHKTRVIDFDLRSYFDACSSAKWPHGPGFIQNAAEQ